MRTARIFAMPIHDWSRVEPGVFHSFHQAWTISIMDALNAGGLPSGYFAMVEQFTGGEYPDVIALERRISGKSRPTTGGMTIADIPPKAPFVTSADLDPYVRKANRVVIKHSAGEVVSVIEIVSPGNKSSRQALRFFVHKAEDLLRRGINLLVVDLFPPTPRDPQGIHKAIWDEFLEESFELPQDKSLTVASYFAGPPPTAYVEPIAVGDVLPDTMPIFLSAGEYVYAPLNASYEETWAKYPEALRELFVGR